ncbi:S-layer homology domain-containing protein [Cytobacillus oceanisediminis]|uniref:S-layer homology domain-containing protein n=1 Tax=Cytobacillus oceanisediminis TaxID=665099 RepID=UPI00373574CD
MKKWLVFLMFFVLLGGSILPYSAQAAGFKDVPNSYWASKEINFLSEKQVIKGYTNGYFGINDPVKRSHAAVMLARTLELDLTNNPDPGFKDVTPDHPAYKEIAAVVEYGIFNKADYFNPNNNITRAQMAKVLAESFLLYPLFEVPFKDVKKSDWFYEYVQGLANYNITTGSNGYYKPGKSLTRTEFSVFLARILDPKFRPGLHAIANEAVYNSNGEIEAEVLFYNNTKNTIAELNARFGLYGDKELIAEHQYTSANPYPVKLPNIALKPGQTKEIKITFKPEEIAKQTNLDLIEYWEILVMYEYKISK